MLAMVLESTESSKSVKYFFRSQNESVKIKHKIKHFGRNRNVDKNGILTISDIGRVGTMVKIGI